MDQGRLPPKAQELQQRSRRPQNFRKLRHEATSKQTFSCRGREGEDDVNTINPVMNENELAEYYDVSVSLLRQWRMRGEGPKYSKLGRGKKAPVRYTKKNADEYIEECQRRSTSDG